MGTLGRLTLALLLSASLGITPSYVWSQQNDNRIAPAEPLQDGWDQIDERLIFLMVRLANVETSIEAIDAEIAKHGRRTASNVNAAKRADKSNERMDRKGGGPMKWSEFYGRTAEAFFYRPKDANTTYHTTTVLKQLPSTEDSGFTGGVPSSHSLPVHQRPPQFDYIYRANEQAKERAFMEAARLGDKIDALKDRKKQLEVDQVALWCEIAFRAVAHHDLDQKPLYRFEPLVVESDTESRRADQIKAAAVFMRLVLTIMQEAEKDQAATFAAIKNTVSEGRKKLADSWLRLAVDTTDPESTSGKFAALAKRLDDIASNLSDSFEVSVEGDEADDRVRKEMFRALLQKSLVNYAEVVLALDEMTVLMADECDVDVDLDTPLVVELAKPATSGSRPRHKSKVNIPRSETASQNGSKKQWELLTENTSFSSWRSNNTADIWTTESDTIVSNGGAGYLYYLDSTYSDFELTIQVTAGPDSNGGLFFRTEQSNATVPPGYEVQIQTGKPTKYMTGSLWGVVSGGIRVQPNTQFTLELTVIGNHIRTKINGEVVVDFVDQRNRFRDGYLALQAQSGTIHYKDLKIRRLASLPEGDGQGD